MFTNFPVTSRKNSVKSTYTCSPFTLNSPFPKSPTPLSQNLFQQSSNPSYLQIIKKQYRNGTFIGTFLNHNVKNGLGLLINDNNQLILGYWHSDRIFGQIVYISDRLRIFGRIDDNGTLQGFNVVKLMDGVLNQNIKNITIDRNHKNIHPITIYGTYKNSKLYGKCVILFKQHIFICTIKPTKSPPQHHHTHSQPQPPFPTTPIQHLQLLQKTKYKKLQLLDNTLHQIFPYIKIFQLNQYLQTLIKKQNQFINNITSTNPHPQHYLKLSKYQPIIKKYPIHNHTESQQDHDSYTHQNVGIKYKQIQDDFKIFYGFSTRQYHSSQRFSENNNMHAQPNKSFQFGFVLYNEELISLGQHSQGKAHGMATVFQLPNTIYAGIFQQGKLSGHGIYYDMRDGKNKYIYGKFTNFYNTSHHYTPTFNHNSTKSPTIPSNIQPIKQGSNWPQSLIKQHHKQHHIKSIYFDPSYTQIDIQLPIQQIIQINTQLKKYFPSNQHQKPQSKTKKHIQNTLQIQQQLFKKNPKIKDLPKYKSPEEKSKSKSLNRKIFNNPNPHIAQANKFSIQPQKYRHSTNYNTQKPSYNFISTPHYQIIEKQPSSRNLPKIPQNKQYQSLYYQYIKNKQTPKQAQNPIKKQQQQLQQPKQYIKQQNKYNAHNAAIPPGRFHLKTMGNQNKKYDDRNDYQNYRYTIT